MVTCHLLCYLVTLILCSVQLLIFGVQIQPYSKVISIWNTDRKFVVCARDRKEFEGRVQWWGPNGRPVGVSHLSNVYQAESSNSSKLYFVRPYKINSGSYVCKHHKNGALVNEETFEMKIYNTIDMTGNIDLYKIEEGGTLRMHCVVKFDSETAEAQVIWASEDNGIIRNLPRYKMESSLEDSGYHRTVNSTLTIAKVKSSDAGFYMCQAIYANSHLTDIKSIDIEVIVQYKPKFEESPIKTIWINDNNQEDQEFVIELKCEAYADPPASFEWFLSNQSLVENLIEAKPKFFEILTKEHMSILTVRLKNMDKFKYYTKNLKDSSRSIMCEARNSYGSDRLSFNFEFGTLPRTPEILYMNDSKETKIITLEINFTEADPPIDMFKLVLSKSYYIYFNDSYKTCDKLKEKCYRIPYDPSVKIEYLEFYAHNPVGWSRSLEMQDTTHSSPNPDELAYEWKLSNFQISVLLFILFLLVASTTVQVVYFNFCVKDSEQDT